MLRPVLANPFEDDPVDLPAPKRRGRPKKVTAPPNDIADERTVEFIHAWVCTAPIEKAPRHPPKPHTELAPVFCGVCQSPMRRHYWVVRKVKK